MDTTNTNLLYLNTNAPVANDTSVFQVYPTDTRIYPMGGYWAGINALGQKYVAYCFTNTEMLQVGSYQGNGSADGPFVALPFKPAFVLIKGIDVGENWIMLDNARDKHNTVKRDLYADSSQPEDSADKMDFVGNGFKVRTTNSVVNGASKKYLYLAIAEEPFKHARGR